MQIFGILASIGAFVMYFCMKYTYALRAKSYLRQPTFREVWSFSFDGHPMRRSIVPMKYIAIFFAFTGLFGWNSPLSQHDINKLWQFPIILLTPVNIWARNTIYEFTHWKNGIEKSMPRPAAFVMLRRSIREIGWFPNGEDWLSKAIVITNILILVFIVAEVTLYIIH